MRENVYIELYKFRKIQHSAWKSFEYSKDLQTFQESTRRSFDDLSEHERSYRSKNPKALVYVYTYARFIQVGINRRCG